MDDILDFVAVVHSRDELSEVLADLGDWQACAGSLEGIVDSAAREVVHDQVEFLLLGVLDELMQLDNVPMGKIA